jgi:hypothetical protein
LRIGKRLQTSKSLEAMAPVADEPTSALGYVIIAAKVRLCALSTRVVNVFLLYLQNGEYAVQIHQPDL